jgi:hypothetical protein
MDNYIAKLSAHLASELSQELGISIAESMNIFISSDLYRMLTDKNHHHYRMSLEEVYERLRGEVGRHPSSSAI